ncbi:MAG: hypothetical protein LBM03_01840 [Erysipelotrichaceae bacterium]|jgi:DNA polymerase-3 subunit delta'|nr:hypothetical protein [Erysipelotrichaceae bacterium]
MEVEKYLKENQPIIYQIFANALKRNTLSHAYLFVGDSGTPLLEIATFLAKSIICDDPTPFACNKCITCSRVDDNNYPDFVVLDGAKGSIKKDMILELETNFDKAAYETKGKKIYILNLVETINVSAINSILKFLEEPKKEVYAFLTTNNITNVLPTIVSRCQVLRVKSISREQIIEEAIGKGVDKLDAELLSYFYNDAILMKDAIKSNKDYHLAKDALIATIEGLSLDINEATFIVETKVLPLLSSKELSRMYFDMLIALFEDIESSKYSNSIYLNELSDKITLLAEKLKNTDVILFEILKSRSYISLNINSSLLLDHIMYIIRKEL